MAKGQIRGNKEVKKPKKPKQVVVPVGSIIPQAYKTPTLIVAGIPENATLTVAFSH